MSPKTRTWQPSALLTPFFISLLTALLGAVLLFLSLGLSVVVFVGFVLLFFLCGVCVVPAEAVVIPIDQRAADALGLPNKPERWPRALHARLVDRLHEAGADTIVFDIHFKEPRDDDGVFAAALRRAGNVVLFTYLDRDNAEPLAQVERLIPPTPALAESAAAIAPFALPKLPVRVSRFWSLQESAGGAATLPLAALEQYALADLPALAAAMKTRDAAAAQRLEQAATHTRAATLAELRAFIQAAPSETWNEVAHSLPREAAMRLTPLHDAYDGDPHPYLNFYGPPRTIMTLPYSDVLDGDQATLAAQVRGKAVFVGFVVLRLLLLCVCFFFVFLWAVGLVL